MLHPPVPAARRRPPVAALLAAPLGVLSAVVTAFVALVALGFSGGDLTGDRWLVVAVPALVSVVLVLGALLLLAGRSWTALAVPAAALALLALVAVGADALGEGTAGVLLGLGALPGLSAVLTALPGVRRWVAARRVRRRAARAAAGPAR